MSEENVRRFLETNEAFNRRDIEAWLEGYDPDAVFEPQAALVEGTYVGPERMRAFMTDVTDTFEVLELRFEDVRDFGDRVLALGTVRGIGKGSGIENVETVVLVARFRNGRITHLKQIRGQGRSPRSRRAPRVGDVGGERRFHPAPLGGI